MLVKYQGRASDQFVRDVSGWLHVERGGTVEMSDDLGAHLCETRPQAWVDATPTPTKAPAKPSPKTSIPEEG